MERVILGIFPIFKFFWHFFREVKTSTGIARDLLILKLDLHFLLRKETAEFPMKRKFFFLELLESFIQVGLGTSIPLF